MISSKSILQMECEHRDGRNLNESASSSAATPPTTTIDRLSSLLPQPTSLTGTSRYANHTHRSINHLSKDLSESSLSMSSSDETTVSGDIFSSGILTCEIAIGRRNPSVANCATTGSKDIHSRDDATHPSCVECYDEGMYVYTSNVIMTECKSNVTPVSSAATVVEADIQCNYAKAQSYIREKKYSDAITFFEITLSLLQQLTPQRGRDDDTNTIVAPLTQHYIYHNIGYCYYCRHQNEMAMAYYQMSLQIAVLCSFDNLIHIATAQNAIAVLLLHKHEQQQQPSPTSSGDDDTANIMNGQLYILNHCHDIYIQTFGAHTKQAATISFNVGRCLACVREYETAIQTFERCLHMRRHLFNDGNTFTDTENDINIMDIAICIYSIGQIHHKSGKHDIAMEWYQQFLRIIASNTQYSYHPNVAKTMMSMAEIYTTKGNCKDAIVHYEYIVEHGTFFFGAMKDGSVIHTDVITAHAKLGNICVKKREYHTALNHYVKSFEMEQDLFRLETSQRQYHHQEPQCHSSTTMIVTLFKIAEVQRKLKLHCTAVQVYMRLYEIHASTHGPYSLEVGRVLSYIGSTLYDDQKYTLALEFFFDAFKVQMMYHSYQDTVEAATTLNSIGLIYFLRQQHTSAELCFTESLRMNIKLFGYDHYDNSILWYNIASTNYEQGLHDKAISFYEAAIRIEALQSSAHPNGNTDTTISQRRSNNTRSLQKLGSIYEKQAELEKAKCSYLQALRIELSLQCQQNIPVIARLLNVVGNIYLQAAEIKPMMECYTTAARLLQQYNLTSDSDCNNDMESVRTGRNHTNDCALIITGYKFYYLSRMHPPTAATA